MREFPKQYFKVPREMSCFCNRDVQKECKTQCFLYAPFQRVQLFDNLVKHNVFGCHLLENIVKHKALGGHLFKCIVKHKAFKD